MIGKNAALSNPCGAGSSRLQLVPPATSRKGVIIAAVPKAAAFTRRRCRRRTMSAPDTARAYISRGWTVVPIPAGRKGPAEEGWQHLRISRDGVAQHFSAGCNIGGILSRFRVTGQRKRWMILPRGSMCGGANGGAEHGGCDGGEPSAIAGVSRLA